MFISTGRPQGLRAWLLAGAAVSALTMPSFAQTAAQDDTDEESVVVTGSRIARSDFTADAPLTVVTGDQIRDSGLTSLGDALRNQLSATSGGFSQTNVLSGGGASSIDLRNFGPDRVLVLINGKRVAAFADSLSNDSGDLSFIPIAMVDRVEILRDGASSTYGQDAVTGVVNVILKDDFEGLNISALQGMSTYGDAELTNVSAVMGGNFERGNAVIGLEYRFADNVPQRERDWATPTVSALNAGSFSIGTFFSPGGVFFGSLGAAVCADWPGAPGTTGIAGEPVGGGTGTVDLYALYGWCPGFTNLVGGAVDRDTYVNYSYDLQQDILTQQAVFAGAAYVTYDIRDDLEVFTELQFALRESTRYLDGSNAGNSTPTIPQGWLVPASNPNNFTGQSGSFYIRTTTTVGTRDEFSSGEQIRSVFGLRGEGLFDKLDWELAYLWTQVNSTLLTKGEFNLHRANIISDPAKCALDTICSAVVNPSGALDVFFPGNWTAEEIDYLRIDGIDTAKFETDSLFGLVQGEVFELPAGMLGIALGFEHRTEKGLVIPDTITQKGENVANQTFTTEGEFDVTELFGELDVPLVKDLPLIQELKVNLQGRWFDYSNFGQDEVWKIGVNWAATEDVRLRFNRGTVFRAPEITDLYGGGTVSFNSISDPCNGAVNPGGTLGANCTADGVVYPFNQLATQVPTLSGSNPNLNPESGDTLTIGLVITPRWIPNLQATIDWWEIELEDVITSRTSDTIVDACYEDSDAASCARVLRNPLNGQVANIIRPLENLGAVRTDGLDISLTYFFDDPLFSTGTTVTLSAEGTYLAENSFAPGAGNIEADDSNSAFPRWVGTAAARFDYDAFGFTWQTRYIADMDDAGTVAAIPNVLGYRGTEAEIEHDIRATFEWDNVSFLAGVNNVFDEEPPFAFESGTNTAFFLYQQAVIGRYFFGRVTVDF